MVGGGGGGRLRVVEKRHLPPAGVLPVHSGKVFLESSVRRAPGLTTTTPNDSDERSLGLRIASINTFAPRVPNAIGRSRRGFAQIRS